MRSHSLRPEENKARRGKKASQELSHGGQALQGCSRMLLPACCFDCLLRFLCLIEQNVARPNLIYDSTRQTEGGMERERETGQHEYFICSWVCSIKRAPRQTPKKQLQLAFAFAVVNNLQSKLLIKLSNIIFMVSVMVSEPCSLPSLLFLPLSLSITTGKLVGFLWWQFNLLLWFYELLMR